jgi:inositol-pentakisphosphate 2-kinase
MVAVGNGHVSTPLAENTMESSVKPDVSNKIQFIGEGAANIVVELRLSDGTNAFPGIYLQLLYSHTYPDTTAANLLRVPKAGTTAYPYTQLQSYWETSIKPLFNPEDLVQQSLLPLADNTTLTKQLNTLLSTRESSRRHDFRGSRVAETGCAMLVEDMRAQNPDDVFLEFKPKWLAQSPSAPAASTRCRNCAREVYGARKKELTGSVPKPCPLKLLSNPDEAVTSLLSTPSPQRDRLAVWLRSDNVLKRLRDLQVKLDRDGPLKADAGDEEFQLAMTLRDCTCFVRIPSDGDRPIEAKLGDLDRKNAEGKMGYWREMERNLVEGGFYEGTEEGGVAVDCGLGR